MASDAAALAAANTNVADVSVVTPPIAANSAINAGAGATDSERLAQREEIERKRVAAMRQKGEADADDDADNNNNDNGMMSGGNDESKVPMGDGSPGQLLERGYFGRRGDDETYRRYLAALKEWKPTSAKRRDEEIEGEPATKKQRLTKQQNRINSIVCVWVVCMFFFVFSRFGIFAKLIFLHVYFLYVCFCFQFDLKLHNCSFMIL